MKSILQERKECFITGATEGLHCHHIFGGKNRRLSEQYGLKVWLRYDWHNGSDYGVHGKYGSKLSRDLKAYAQQRAMEHYGWTVESLYGYSVKIIYRRK